MPACSRLSDEELRAKLKFLAARERQAAFYFVVHLIEADKRRLYAEAGYPSLFVYCTRDLGLSEDAAYKRIQVARAAARFPALLEELAAGRIQLRAAGVLAPRLTADNCQGLLEQARGKPRREVEFLVAGLAPQAVKKDHLPRIIPMSSDRARVSFDAGKDLLEMIQRVRRLLLAKHPTGRLEAILKEVFEDFLARRDWGLRPAVRRRRLKKEGTPSPPSREIPLWVRREVWRRDGGQCTFQAEGGRCPERGGLEFDHVLPWALGGPSDRPENIRLLCRAHNQLLARRAFGAKADHRRSDAPS